jgi:hypothetical protein
MTNMVHQLAAEAVATNMIQHPSQHQSVRNQVTYFITLPKVRQHSLNCHSRKIKYQQYTRQVVSKLYETPNAPPFEQQSC